MKWGTSELYVWILHERGIDKTFYLDFITVTEEFAWARKGSSLKRGTFSLKRDTYRKFAYKEFCERKKGNKLICVHDS